MLRLSLALLTLIIAACDQLGGQASQDDVRSLADRIEQSPTDSDVRLFLNMRVDGATSYYHMARLGRLFALQPELFKRIYGDLKTDLEREHFRRLGLIGTDVFMYYPEFKPDIFDQVYQEAGWLKKN